MLLFITYKLPPIPPIVALSPTYLPSPLLYLLLLASEAPCRPLSRHRDTPWRPGRLESCVCGGIAVERKNFFWILYEINSKLLRLIWHDWYLQISLCLPFIFKVFWSGFNISFPTQPNPRSHPHDYSAFFASKDTLVTKCLTIDNKYPNMDPVSRTYQERQFRIQITERWLLCAGRSLI